MNKSVMGMPSSALLEMLKASDPATYEAVLKAQNKSFTNQDTKIKHEGKQIILPSDPQDMDYDQAIATIQRVKEAENKTYYAVEHIKGAPWDTHVAVYRALQEIYGVVIMKDTPGFFGPTPPQFITVRIGEGADEVIQIPYGTMSVPGFESNINVQVTSEGTYINAKVKPKEQARLVEIANKARELLRTKSIYKGKAIQLNVDEDGDLILSQEPTFLNLSAVRESDIIHTKDTEALIKNSIFAPLKFTDQCRTNNIPLKRGILLEGRYGTGKSLTARVTAKVAIDNGWTFIMLNRSQGLGDALAFAKNYQPCVIFAEDIDRAADREDESVNDLVNMLDGVTSKQDEIMVVLTTNFIEKIDRSLLRPGRFDAVISIDAPDAETAERIIRSYGAGLLAEGEDLTRVGEVTAGMIPASIREVMERAKLSMLTEGRDKITADDLYTSAIGMTRHMALLADKPVEKSVHERLGLVFAEVIAANAAAGPIDEAMSQLEKQLRHIESHVCN